jgi:hypothetical protein
MTYFSFVRCAFALAAGCSVVALASSDGAADASDLAAMQAKFEIRGKAIGVDGEPAEKVRAVAQTLVIDGQNQDGADGDKFVSDPGTHTVLLLAQRRASGSPYKDVAKSISETDGTFVLKNLEPGSYRVMLGDPEKTEWDIKGGVRVKDKNVDLGEVQLREPVRRRR